MFVPCPHCGFLVALIVSRASTQRCPRCHKPLQMTGEDMPDSSAPLAGTATAADQPPDATSTADPETSADADPALATAGSTSRPSSPRTPGSRAGNADTNTEADPEPASNRPAADRPAGGKPGNRRRKPTGAPSFARRSVSMIELGPRWPGLLAIAVLLALLALQLLLAQRDQLAADARWRPTVAFACKLLGCEVPPWREPAAFTMLDRKVRPAPAQPGVLLVAASFRNDARWPQPWPRLLLRLSDSNGRTVGQGVFTAAQYRQADAPEVLAPGQSASVHFAVREPATSTVAFQFEFR